MSTHLYKIIDLLQDSGYHDCPSIGNRLGITGTAVWEIIKKLREYGIEIDSVKGKGYALKDPLILLNKQHIRQELGDIDIQLDIFESLKSTNRYSKSISALYQHSGHNIYVCLAEQQTLGKGRFNRRWHSPFGQNIYCSVTYPFRKNIDELNGLSLIVSLAIVNTLSSIYDTTFSAAVKWPNDVIVEDKKLAGSLIEIQAEANGIYKLVTGIGINVNMLTVHEDSVSKSWTSIRRLTGTYIDRNMPVAKLITRLIYYFHQFETYGLQHFMDEWNRVDYLYGQQISLKYADHNITGNAQGIDTQGNLLIKPQNTNIKAFPAGDTTILKNK